MNVENNPVLILVFSRPVLETDVACIKGAVGRIPHFWAVSDEVRGAVVQMAEAVRVIGLVVGFSASKELAIATELKNVLRQHAKGLAGSNLLGENLRVEIAFGGDKRDAPGVLIPPRQSNETMHFPATQAVPADAEDGGPSPGG